MDKIDREKILPSGFKLDLEKYCPREVLNKIDELVDGYNELKTQIQVIKSSFSVDIKGK